MQVNFISKLKVEHIDYDEWQLIADYFVSIEKRDEIYLLSIPSGFNTDFCSVPRLPFAYLLLGGIAQYAGLMHDALYSGAENVVLRNIESLENFEYSRAWADKVFLYGLKQCGIGIVKRHLMYYAVRTHGWRYFKKQLKNHQK